MKRTESQKYEVYNVYIFFSLDEKDKVHHDPANLIPTINTTFEFEYHHSIE